MIGLENQVSVFLRVAVLHKFYCNEYQLDIQLFYFVF